MTAPAKKLRTETYGLLEADGLGDAELHPSTPAVDDIAHQAVWMGGHSEELEHGAIGAGALRRTISQRVVIDAYLPEADSVDVLDTVTDITERVVQVIKTAITSKHNWGVGRGVTAKVSSSDVGEPEPHADGGWVCTGVVFVEFRITT